MLGAAFQFAPFSPRCASESYHYYENRVLEALRVAQHQVRLAQAQAAPRMLSALVGLEDALSDQIAWLENAAENEKADAEESGEAERERQTWRPLRAA
jgi:hypothetical protein